MPDNEPMLHLSHRGTEKRLHPGRYPDWIRYHTRAGTVLCTLAVLLAMYPLTSNQVVSYSPLYIAGMMLFTAFFVLESWVSVSRYRLRGGMWLGEQGAAFQTVSVNWRENARKYLSSSRVFLLLSLFGMVASALGLTDLALTAAKLTEPFVLKMLITAWVLNLLSLWLLHRVRQVYRAMAYGNILLVNAHCADQSDDNKALPAK